MVHGFPRSDEGRWGPLLEAGLGAGHNGKCLVAAFALGVRPGTARRGNVSLTLTYSEGTLLNGLKNSSAYAPFLELSQSFHVISE